MNRSITRGVSIFHGLTVLLVKGVVDATAAPPIPARSPFAHYTQSISWNELGAKATAEYSGDGLAVTVTADGARLRCVFQKLEGEVTREGLWLSSTAPGSSNTPFRVQATSVWRERGARRTLPSAGTVETAGGLARFIRPGLTEEYSVTVDGLRQDFLLPERLPGQEALRVELKVCRARVEASPDGARLVLDNGGRKLNYHRLRATDATGRELAAWIELRSPSQLAVLVEDGGAKYPVRIDPTFSDANWTSMGGFPGLGDVKNRGIPGLVDSVGAVAADGWGNLYVGGSFSIAGEVFAANIARWDGSSWSALGAGITATDDHPFYGGSVNALAVAGTNLYAAGAFTSAGSIAATNVAKWNGSTWSALDSGLNSNVFALAVSGSDVYAAGWFTSAGGVPATNVAKWNGTSWSAMPSGMNGTVRALAASGTDLYVGGTFTRASGIAATNIAKWNGTSWSALGSGLDGDVHALAIAGTDVYAGGNFTRAGSTAATNIAKWNGSNWSAVGSGINDSGVWVAALAVTGTNLYAGGFFYRAGAIGADSVAKWNGNIWSALGPGINNRVNALLASGSDLYAAGNFTTSSGANFIARRDGSNWSSLGLGVNGPAYALTVSGSNLYAGGYFMTAAGATANSIAQWNGSSWSPLGLGIHDFEDPFGLGTVYALAALGTNLYAGGDFAMAGDVAAANIAKWDGTSWSALGSGVNNPVYALAVLGSNLYAGGWFDMAGGSAVSSIANWDGSSWSALGSGMRGPFEDPFELGYVYALAALGSNLYAGGIFTTAGGTAATNIAKWNGDSWSPLGVGMGGFFVNVSALVVAGSDLYAGGYFTTAGSIPANNIARWNGSSWSALGLGTGGNFRSVSALAVTGPDLYAGGSFSVAGGKVVGHIAKARIGSVAKSIAGTSGSAVIQFSGVTGYEYDVQRATTLSPPITWTTVTPIALSPADDGSFTFHDTNAPVGAAYYRAVQR